MTSPIPPSGPELQLAGLRKDYALDGLVESDLAADPFTQFGIWFGEAQAASGREPNAMTLATASPDGVPSTRTVLLKTVDARGFVFYSNYESRKAGELAENPRASLLLYWDPLGRQVRIEGSVARVSTAKSDTYYRSRSLGSRLGAWASAQSTVIAEREVLEERLAEAEAEHGVDPPLPPFWGGYLVRPEELEFWQNRADRLHDRFRYRPLPAGGWSIERLSP